MTVIFAGEISRPGKYLSWNRKEVGMSFDLDVKEIERRAYMSYSEDGLVDIAIGFVFLGWGVLLVDKLPGLFALLGPIAWAIWYLGKRFLTVPRIGIIEPSQRMENRMRNLSITLIILGLTALAGALLAVGRDGSFLADYSLGLLGLVFAAGICLVAFLLAANRLYAYAMMLFVAFLGLLANGGSMWVLYKDRSTNINIKGAYLHMMADTLGSMGAIVAGIVIWTTGWTPIDQIVSFIIGILILLGSWELIAQTINILLEATPENIDYDEVKKAMEQIEHVKKVHDLHIWTISSGIPSLSAHIRLYSECSDSNHWQICLKNMQKLLREKFNIVHSTLQFEPEDFERDSRCI